MSGTVGAISPASVGRTLQAWLEEMGTPLVLRDRATNELLPAGYELAGDPGGLLPVFLVAGEAVWREATGKGFALAVQRDPAALLGYRMGGIGAGSFCSVLLSTIEAASQVARPDRLLVNDLFGAVWKATMERADQSLAPRAIASPAPRSEASPS